MSEPDPRRSGATRALIICAFVAPVAGFLMLMILWTGVNGLPSDGRGLLPGLGLVLGIAVIVALYLLVERHWIRRP